jgi:hypothetical protein
MMHRLQYLFVSAAIGLSTATPGSAQTLDEMKAEIQALQKRVEQLERERKPPPVQHPAPVARAPSRAPVKTAQQPPAPQPAAPPPEAQAQQNAVDLKAAVAAEVKATYAPPPGKPGGLTVRIPGTDTTVRLYGFVKLNAISDLTTYDANDSLTAQSIQLFNTPAQRQGGGTQFSARRSRIGFETWTPVKDSDFGEFHTQVEMDFAGQNTSLTTQATSNSYTPRLRKAYADFGSANGGWGALLFGQQDSVFNDTSLLPIQWMADWTFVGIDNIRQAQVRYSYGFGNGLSVAAAVESPYSDVTTTAGTSYPNSNGGGGIGWQTTPDFTGRVLWKQDWGLLALRGVVRPQIDLNNQGATAINQQFKQSTSGYGVGVTGNVQVIPGRFILMASGNAGNGLGRYLDSTANGYGAVSSFGIPGSTLASTSGINAVGVYGGMVGAQVFFTPLLRTNMALGGARLILPGYTSQFGGCVGSTASTGTCAGTNTSEYAASINLVWSPFKAVDLGLEYQYVARNLQQRAVTGPGLASSGGIENRIELTAIGRY